MPQSDPTAIAVIPARYGSQRLPGKALADVAGRPLVVRVLERARRCRRLHQIVVATDDTRIFEAVRAAGGEARWTRADHSSGTDRVAEVVASFPEDRLVVNIQGDEPLLNPAAVDALIDAYEPDGPGILTASAAFEGDPSDASRVKVVTDAAGRALYFSRAPIPVGGPYRLHVGLYAFRAGTLRALAALPVGALERSERLEQLRWLEAGYAIRVVPVESGGPSVDTAADLERVRALFLAAELAPSPLATLHPPPR